MTRLEELNVYGGGLFSIKDGLRKDHTVTATPVATPFAVDIGCPKDQLGVYYWAFGRENRVRTAIVNYCSAYSLQDRVNAYACSESLSFNSSDRSAVREHRIVAVQLYHFEDSSHTI